MTISGGQAAIGGGVYLNRGALSLTSCTISGNSASGNGGGLFNNSYGTVSLINSTISGNTADASAGGLYEGAVGTTLSLTNCTFSGNYANLSGGGVFIGGGTSKLTNCTVGGNTGGVDAGGLYVFDTPTLIDTIVAGNTGGDVRGALDPGSTNNLIGGVPLLAPLGDYGGATQTMALLPGSPAIGGGMSGAGIPTADQRGQSRAGHTDIGSFQSQGFNLTPVAHSTPQSATAGKGFSNPLAVTVTAKNLAEPVNGGVVRFSGPATGASAGLSAGTAAIQGGQAAVTATANDLPGGYTVTATAAGAGSAAFDLTNTASLGLTHENPSPARQEASRAPRRLRSRLPA